MKLYVTGATGFVGAAVVDEALERGHEVVAVVRPASTRSPLEDAPEDAALSEARIDLRSPEGLVKSLEGVDSVVHLAAAKSGDFYTQFAGTVVATENLLTAMVEVGVNQLVGISTFSVYDYLAMDADDLLTEDSPIDTDPKLRDEYAQTKLIQERLYHQFGDEADNLATVLRPGMIYGADNLWHALLGADFGSRFLRIGSKATLPLAYVENCAQAIVDSVEALSDRPDEVAGEIINIVDDDLPTQEQYVREVAARVETPPTISIPWPAMNAATTALKKANSLLVGGRAKLPGIAVPDRLHARFKPLRYSNEKAKRLLQWNPRYSFTEALDRSVAAQHDHAAPVAHEART